MSIITILSLILLSTSTTTKAETKETVIDIQYDAEKDSQGESEETSALNFGALFKNPALASGLNAGTQALNRSIDSLMEAVFYSIMDHDFRARLTDSSSFLTAFTRDVEQTSDGSHVVIDRFRFGPEFSRQLSQVQGVPITLGAGGFVSIMNIYYRSNAMRIADEEELPFWRNLINNWFGALPLLTRVLPPSFNPNEIYDPITELEAAFLFPFNANKISSMPIGSIRSYSISGGVQIPFDVSATRSEKVRERILGQLEPNFSVPLILFRNGEHRINVLRKNNYTAWVGLSESSEIGASVSVLSSKTYQVFAKLVPFWHGIPTVFIPIDLTGVNTDRVGVDQLYSFDLRKKSALTAYQQAVQGDFSLAWEAHRKRLEEKKPTGVTFLFNRKAKSNISKGNNERALVLKRTRRSQSETDSEVETRDPEGRFFTLESEVITQDEDWDILVGGAVQTYSSKIKCKVNKVLQPSNLNSSKESFVYQFRDAKDPLSLTLSLHQQDNYMDAQDFRRAIKRNRNFTLMPMTSIPDIEVIDAKQVSTFVKKATFANPLDNARLIRPTPGHLGKFSSTAAIFFGSEAISALETSSTKTIWQSFAQAFGLPKNEWDNFRNDRSPWTMGTLIAGSYLLYPTRLINLRLANIDAIRETKRKHRQIKLLKDSHTPKDKLFAYAQLLKTDYPSQLTNALVRIASNTNLPKSILFHTKPKGQQKLPAKKVFENLNLKTFKAGPKRQKANRYDKVDETLKAFVPTNLKAAKSRAKVHKVSLKTKKEMAPAIGGHLVLHVTTSKVPRPLSIYLKLEQDGKVDVGRFNLAEAVYQAAQIEKTEKDLFSTSVAISGPRSPLNNFSSRQALDFGGDFKLTLAVRGKDQGWSLEKVIRFKYENNKLARPDKAE